MPIVDRYVNGVHKHTKYFATWLPGSHMSLGDVGLMEGRVFHKVTTLADRGIPFAERIVPAAEADYDFSENEKGSLTFKASGEAAPAGSALSVEEAGASIVFAGDGSFVFQAKGCVERSIADLVQLGWDVLVDMKNAGWQHDWVVVDTVVTAQSGTILISEGRSTKLDISASAAAFPAGQARLASAAVGLSVKRQSGSIAQCIARTDLTPLYRISRVRGGIFRWLTGRVDFRPMRGPADLGALDTLPEPPTEGDRVLEPVEPPPLESWE